VSQSEYAKMVLARYEMAEVYGANTPMECGVDLNDASELAKDVPYGEAIGSLMYLMVGARPDIVFAMSQLSKFVESPTTLPPVECSQKSDEVHQRNGGSWTMLQIWWQV
jgi:hypothetical protein